MAKVKLFQTKTRFGFPPLFPKINDIIRVEFGQLILETKLIQRLKRPDDSYFLLFDMISDRAFARSKGSTIEKFRKANGDHKCHVSSFQWVLAHDNYSGKEHQISITLPSAVDAIFPAMVPGIGQTVQVRLQSGDRFEAAVAQRWMRNNDRFYIAIAYEDSLMTLYISPTGYGQRDDKAIGRVPWWKQQAPALGYDDQDAWLFLAD